MPEILTPTLDPHDFGPPQLEWEALIVPHHERSDRWYLIGGIVVVAITALSIITGAWSVALVTILCGGMYVLMRDHVPVPRHIAVYDHGVVFNGKYDTWKSFRNFWLLKTAQYTELHLVKNNGNTTVIQTGPMHPDKVRQVLSSYLPEDAKISENFIATIFRICKL